MKLNYAILLLPWIMLGGGDGGWWRERVDGGDDAERVLVLVDDSGVAAQVDAEGFICATLDWWPPNKCDYGTCSWGHASILNLNLSSPVLQKAIKAFSPLRIRLGGTLQDKVVYHVGQKAEPCRPFVRNSSDLFGFSNGCLPMWRWDELNAFFQNVRCQVAFGLNALFGRTSTQHEWDPQNAFDFIQYTHEKGYDISAWEFGNELSGTGVGIRIPADQYASDVKRLYQIIQQVYADQPTVPLVVAPDGFFDESWTTQFIQAFGGEHCVNVISHHIYNLGPGVDKNLIVKILDPAYLDRAANTFRTLQNTLQQYGPWADAWVGEAGGAYNSGHHLVTDAFVMSFWYLDQLGMAASYGTRSYCRQSLIGGNYGLLNTTTFAPNPDYYSALLWHRLMGANVLKTEVSGSKYIRAYSHCAKDGAGISLVLFNLHNQTTFSIELSILSSPVIQTRMEYHLTAKDNELSSQTVLLNGEPLELTDDGDIPALLPQSVSDDTPLLISPLSIAFISLPIQIQTCSS
ncbi:hypothetical protein KP509_07G069000 [Ceratopteris richardii]|uniref:Uncharacterized protein n=1 Tax=Ceratopteris richardii TaxID=49495 RepID=A0A8T2UBV6_CERRI|nr:hypothetical protein KP509_07G069000 [Ceratopteris richardii]